MRRALVTGATGGLGLALTAALLDAGYAVRATGRQPSALQRLQALGAETVAGDLLSLDLGALCQGRDVIFHAAALSSPWGPEEVFRRINVEATVNLLLAARAGGADAFVFVSSPSIHASLHDQHDLTEASPPAARPMNAYARTKLEAERRVLAAQAPGFTTVSVRPRALIGPDDAVLLPRVLRLVERGRFPLFRDGRALIELTDVRDVAHALVLADQRRAHVAGRAVNISGGRPVSVRTLAQALGEATGRPLRMIRVPMGPALLLTRLLEGLCAILPGRPEPPLTPYGLAALAYSQTFDLTFAREALGYVPRYDALETARAIAAEAMTRRTRP